MKGLATKNCNCNLRLFDAVPPPPQDRAGSRDRDESDPRRRDFKQLLAKHNWEFRRPFPHHTDFRQLDKWRKVHTWWSLHPDHLNFLSGHFQAPVKELLETSIWNTNDVNWGVIGRFCSSMLVPTYASSAVRDWSPLCSRCDGNNFACSLLGAPLVILPRRSSRLGCACPS